MSSFDPPPRRADDSNPYAAPDLPAGALIGGPILDPFENEDEEIRRANLTHEASVKSIGTLYYVSAAFVFLVTVLTLVQGKIPPPKPGTDPVAYRIGVMIGVGFLFALCGVNVALGFGLRRLQPWARWTVAALTGLGMAAFLVMTAVIAATVNVGLFELLFLGIGASINIYVIYLLVGSKGETVFSARYKDVIARTPHIKYRMSILIKIALGFLVLILLMAIIAPLIHLFLKH